MNKEDILAAVEAKRGYLLPYHRMLANDDPELLAAYDRLYEKLTLVPRVLSAQEREFVWMGLLAMAREEHGHIHARRAVDAGMSLDEIGDAIALAGAAEAFSATNFATKNWSEWVPAESAVGRYLKICEAARGAISLNLAEIILSVCQAARGRADAERLHLVRAFEAGASVGQMAEAMSYLLLPCGGPVLIDAVAAWEEAAVAGLCPSPYGD
ncbi:MAG: carboxymuconolactone decarboxylase family protein [Alphaproteobacteria bacterium]|nr:carboxymuconolactone decarboxylase family protein [Alphaproteobacteria bacterium]